MPRGLPSGTGTYSRYSPRNVSKRRGRRHARRQTIALVGSSVLALLLALIVVTPVAAAEFVTGDNPRIPASRTLDDDLYLAGDQAVIAGTINGDALVASRNLDLSGTVERSLAVAANEVVISGNVGHAVRAAVNELRITEQATIGGDLVAFASTIVIEPGVVITGDLIAAGNVEMRGEVGGDLRVTGDTVVIDGPVGGDVRPTSDTIELGPNARVAGDFQYTSDTEADVDAQAQIAGAVEREEPGSRSLDDAAGVGGGAIGELFRLLAALVAGLVVILVMPRATVAVAESVRRRTGPSLLLGLILLFAIPVMTIILMVTVIGIPIGLITLATYLILLYLSQVFVGTAIGRWILPNSWGDGGRGFNLLAMALGVILLGAVRLIPIPAVDILIAAATAILGLGAVFVGLRRRPTPALPVHGQQGPAYY